MGDELGQRPRALQHEGVDRDPVARAALDLAQRLLDRATGRRVAELDLAVLEMGGRLAVGDNDDLLVGGGLPSDASNPPPPPPSDPNARPVGDEGNLEYARKQTDLVLDRLENQLKGREVDPELLDKLGWSEDDLKKFVDRWRNMKQAAQAGGEGSAAKRELDDTLRSMIGSLRKHAIRRDSGNVPTDDLRDLQAGNEVVPRLGQDRVGSDLRGGVEVVLPVAPCEGKAGGGQGDDGKLGLSRHGGSSRRDRAIR